MDDEKAIQFAKAVEYARVLLEGHPGINSRDFERKRKWIEATLFFEDFMTIPNPVDEPDSEESTENAKAGSEG